MLYENDMEHCKLKFMGLSLKRRDCCNYLKDVYGGVLNRFLYSTEKPPQENTTQKQTTKLQQDVASAIQSTPKTTASTTPRVFRRIHCRIRWW